MDNPDYWERALTSIAASGDDPERAWAFLVDEGLVRKKWRARTRFLAFARAEIERYRQQYTIGGSAAHAMARYLGEQGLLTEAAAERDPHGSIAQERFARWHGRPLPPRHPALREVVAEAVLDGLELAMRLGSEGEIELFSAHTPDYDQFLLAISPAAFAVPEAVLDHPYVLRFSEPQQLGALWVARTDYPSMTLAEAIRRRNLYEPFAKAQTQMLTAAHQLADALAFMHARGLVHDDLHPASVTWSSTATRLALGLAKTWAHRAATSSGNGSGAAPYAPPEGRGSARGDVWSWAITVMDMLVGDTERGRDATSAIERYAVADRMQGIPRVPDGLLELLRTCVDKDPARRPDMATIARELAAL